MYLGPLSDDIDLDTGRSHGRPGLGPCGHPEPEPVRLLDGDEIVAWLCGRCDTQLPADWKPKAPSRDDWPKRTSTTTTGRRSSWFSAVRPARRS